VKIYFDGGARPNPGKIETAVVAGGRSTIRHDHAHGDNSDAEWLALLDALMLAQNLALRDVLLLGDSQMVVDQALGRAARIAPRFRAYLEQFHAATPQFDRIRVRHVARAQNLAGIALDKARQWPG